MAQNLRQVWRDLEFIGSDLKEVALGSQPLHFCNAFFGVARGVRNADLRHSISRGTTRVLGYKTFQIIGVISLPSNAAKRIASIQASIRVLRGRVAALEQQRIGVR